MSGERVVVTEGGTLTLKHVSRETLEALARLFPRLGFMESERGELLALATAHESRGLRGLRSGYGWYEPEHAAMAEQVALLERLRLPHALAVFAKRGFHGVLLAATCVAGFDAAHRQQGELLFVHVDAPLDSPTGGEALPTYEKLFGPGASAALLGFLADANDAWKAGGLPERVLTDLEPCFAHDANVRWWADAVLVDGRVVLVRPELADGDLVLAELARAGFTEVEFAASSFVLVRPDAADEA